MNADFFAGFIVSLFNEKTSVTTKQLSLIAAGKRTPSVLFNVEKNNLYTLFGLFPEVSLKGWERVGQTLLDYRLVKSTEDALSLTEKGFKARESFITDFPVNNGLEQLRYSTTKPLYWNRMIFTTQVFSEYSYKNKQYVPYLSSLEDQRNMKKWLVEQGRPMDELAQEWFRELKALFQSLPAKEADFIAGHFSGHHVSGSTSRQLQERYGLSKEHYTVFIDQLSYKIVQHDNKRFPLLLSLWNRTHLDCDEGLSHSARLSRRMLERGKGIDEVAVERKLKANTIREHILECVLITDWPHFKQYIRPDHYTACHTLIGADPAVSYAEAKNEITDLDFFTFRLIEIERMRRHG
ncbi:Uncharacterized protein YpbB [Alkalibacterium subtropicum]|uniref:Uncharacterized protein YpbB n=1 Tax=Alkalibacterium subtropicum TaxID=753702 RepID=A0A1I1EM61_9LACT|nr:helix-turn-helix domain-containing protein [Alkalibacterium subtropicum]SFB88269.1 Uncharacterized protein YpbB [Alkalibacterium subtropicum]